MKNKKAFSLLLCLIMLFSMFPVSVFAEDESTETENVEEDDILMESALEDIGEDDNLMTESVPMKSEETDGSVPEDDGSEPDQVAEEQLPENAERPQKEIEDEAPDEPESSEEENEEDQEEELPEGLEDDFELLPVHVRFLVTPEDAVLAVYKKDDLGEKEELQPEEDGSWLLLPGEYFYTATVEGYEPVYETGFIVPEESGSGSYEISVVLVSFEDAAPVEAMSSSGKCGKNLTWTLDDDGLLTISGTGAMEDYYYVAPWGSSVKAIVINQGVTSIGGHAFSNCSSLTSVTIPDSVTSIEGSAFYDCRSLTSVTIPDSVTSIGGSAFSGCSSLTSVTIPDSVTSIGGSAFSKETLI